MIGWPTFAPRVALVGVTWPLWTPEHAFPQVPAFAWLGRADEAFRAPAVFEVRNHFAKPDDRPRTRASGAAVRAGDAEPHGTIRLIEHHRVVNPRHDWADPGHGVAELDDAFAMRDIVATIQKEQQH